MISKLPAWSPRTLLWASVVVAIITIGLKSGAWLITDSVGLLSDAMESLVNLASAVFGLVMVTVAARPADAEHPYGHHKAEYFSSGFEGILIIVAAIGISEEPNSMFAKVLSISDVLMWRWYTLLSFKSMADIEMLKKQVADGLNPKEAKVALAKEITTRFHGSAAADAAEQDFINRSKGGVPDEIDEVNLSGAPLGIGTLLKMAGLAPSGSEANRLIDGGGVRVDSSVVSDKGLKLEAGTYVVQVGKRKFARVHLSA